MVLAFCMGTDINGILHSPIGQPMASIFFNSFGQKGTLAIWAIVVIVQCVLLLPFCCGICVTISYTSRVDT